MLASFVSTFFGLLGFGLAVALVVWGAIHRYRYPRFRLVRTPCRQCSQVFSLPGWAVKGFICGRCRAKHENK